MALNYNLASNESIIMKNDSVSYGRSYYNELILTNQQIILVIKGTFGNTKNVKYFSLSQIKNFNNQAQVFIGKSNNGRTTLDVYFLNGQESFGFDSKRTLRKWVENITTLVNGEDVVIDQLGSHNGGQFDDVREQFTEAAKQVKEQFGLAGSSFKNAFGFQNKQTDTHSLNNEKITTKCPSCGAPITGKRGNIVSCQYCDTDNHL